MPTDQEIGQRITSLRKELGLSQAELLRRARRYLPGGESFAPATLSRIENGERRANSWMLNALAAAMGTTAGYLATGQEQHEAPGPEPLSLPLPEPDIAELVRRLNSQPRTVRLAVAKLVDAALELAPGAAQGTASREQVTRLLDNLPDEEIAHQYQRLVAKRRVGRLADLPESNLVAPRPVAPRVVRRKHRKTA